MPIVLLLSFVSGILLLFQLRVGALPVRSWVVRRGDVDWPLWSNLYSLAALLGLVAPVVYRVVVGSFHGGEGYHIILATSLGVIPGLHIMYTMIFPGACIADEIIRLGRSRSKVGLSGALLSRVVILRIILASLIIYGATWCVGSFLSSHAPSEYCYSTAYPVAASSIWFVLACSFCGCRVLLKSEVRVTSALVCVLGTAQIVLFAFGFSVAILVLPNSRSQFAECLIAGF